MNSALFKSDTLEINVGSLEKRSRNFSKFRLFWILLAISCLFAIGYVSGYFTPHASATVNTESSWQDGPCPIITGDQCPSGYLKAPPLLLVSFDGFRASYLERSKMTAFKRLQQCGVHASSMRPTHPSITFPNHYSIATGLFSESHGIVENKFYDPELKMKFDYKRSKESVWWKGQPIWVTAKKQGKRAYAYFFVGTESEIQGERPDVCRNFDSAVPYNSRVDTVLEWLSEPDQTRPDITTLYFEEPDSSGHTYGTEGAGITETLIKVNSVLDRLMQGLHDRNILQCVNVIVLSDHGMDDVSCDKRTFLQPIFDQSPIGGRLNETDYFLYGGEMGRISLTKSAENVTDEDIYDALKCGDPKATGVFSAYQPYRKRDMPRRLHYTNSDRLEPTILNVKAGHTVYKSNSNFNYCDGGMHGYDNLYDSMQTIFLAHGPSFKSGLKIEPFQNIELYNLMSALIQVEPAENNGTYGSLNHVLRKPQPLPDTTMQWKTETAKFPDSLAELQRRQNPSCWLQCDPSSDDETKTDLLLNISSVEGARRLAASLPYGVPDASEQILLINTDYVIGYNVEIQLPIWASWSLISQPKVSGESFSSSVTCAQNDVRFETGRTLTCADLPINSSSNLESTYLFPPGLSSTSLAVNDAHLVTNVVPMYTSFKNDVWSAFWKMFGDWTARGWKMNVISGPVFDSYPPFGILDNPENKTFSKEYPKLRVPSHYFIVVTRDGRNASCVEMECRPDVLAFILPHEEEERQPCQDLDSYILTHSATVRDVERVTGIRFYTEVPVYEAIRLRTQLPTKLWHLETGL